MQVLAKLNGKKGLIAAILTMALLIGAYNGMYYNWTVSYSISPLTQDIGITIPATSGATEGSYTLGFVLEMVGDGAAGWTDEKAYDSTFSVKLLTGGKPWPDNVGDGAWVYIPVDPIPFQEFVEPSFYYLELAGAVHGGEFPGDWNIPYPYGTPYIVIYIDSDGDGEADAWLIGTGSTAGGEVTTEGVEKSGSTKGVYPEADTWTVMKEGWGYRDAFDTLGSPYGAGMVYFEEAGHEVWRIDDPPGSIEDWKGYLGEGTPYPDATVVGVDLTFGGWQHPVPDPVYVDDVTINGVTYDLEAYATIHLEKASDVHFMVSADDIAKLAGDYYTIDVTISLYEGGLLAGSATLLAGEGISGEADELITSLAPGDYTVCVDIDYWTGAVDTGTGSVSFVINVYAVEG